MAFVVSRGVIVYGMVTGSLPFVGTGGGGGAAAGEEGEGRSRPQLRAAIARGFSRKHRAALIAFSPGESPTTLGTCHLYLI